MISLVVSLTTTPMMCARILRYKTENDQSRLSRFAGQAFECLQKGYEHTLRGALKHSRMTMAVLLAVIGLNGLLFYTIPKGFFPSEDTGRLMGGVQGDQSISFQSMRLKLEQFVNIIKGDPEVENVVGFTGGGS